MTDTIEPFRIDIPQAQLDDLQLRLTRTRWPDRQPVPDWSQGIPLDVVTELCRCWREEYDWRATEQRLNQIPQFRVTVDDLPIHFLHVRSRHSDATPLVLTHGWPGSFLEFEQVLPLLTDPPDDSPAFHVVAAVAARIRVQRPTHHDRLEHPPHRPSLVRTHHPAGLPALPRRRQRLGYQHLDKHRASAS